MRTLANTTLTEPGRTRESALVLAALVLCSAVVVLAFLVAHVDLGK